MKANKTHFCNKWLAISAVCLPILLSFIVLNPGIPLGEPGVWVWQRILPFHPDLTEILGCGLFFAIGGAAAWKLDRNREQKHRLLLAAVIMLCGIGADRIILTSGRAGLAENALAVLNPFTTGYLQPEQSTGAITRNFVKDILTVPQGEVPHHRHVHPPANFYLAALVQRLPGKWGEALLPDAHRELCLLQKANGLIPPLDTPEMMEAALKMTVIFWIALELGKFLLAWILWRIPGVRGRGIALLTAAMGSNGAILFLGHYDTFYFLITSLLLFVLFYALRKPHLAVGAGILTGCGGLFTLGFGAPGGVAAGVLLTGPRPEQRWKTVGYFAGTGIVMAILLQLCGIHIFAIAFKCWENQQLFQQMSGRSYFFWCGLNVLDALLFCGVLPVLALLIPPGGRGRGFKMWFCALFFWLFILFSGGARGEFGRLAIVYLPVLLLSAGIRLGRVADNKQLWFWYFAAIGLMLWQTALLRNTLKLVLID